MNAELNETRMHEGKSLSKVNGGGRFHARKNLM